jgi:transcriptional regulator with XRE-family HTH domain
MATRETRLQHGHRAARRARAELCKEFRERRVQLGLSQATVGAAAGISDSYYGRIERGEVRAPAFEVLWAIGAALGLDLRFGIYPAGEPVHDQAELPILETTRALLPSTTAWRTEVVLPGEGDLRAWDAVAMAADGWTAFEAISRLGVVDVTVRRVHQKLRDDPRVTRVVLLLSDTVRNRQALQAAGSVLRADFPLATHEVLAHLRAGRTPPLHGIAIIRVNRRP